MYTNTSFEANKETNHLHVIETNENIFRYIHVHVQYKFLIVNFHVDFCSEV